MNYFKTYYIFIITIALCLLFVTPIHSQESEISTYFNALSQAKQKGMHRFQVGEYLSKRINNTPQLFDQVLNNKDYAPYWEDTLWQYYYYNQDQPTKVVDFMWDFAKQLYPKPSESTINAQHNALIIISSIMCNPDLFNDNNFRTKILDDIVESIIQNNYYETAYWQNRFEIEELSLPNKEQVKHMTKEELVEQGNNYLHSKLPQRTSKIIIYIISYAHYYTEDSKYKEILLQIKTNASPFINNVIDYALLEEAKDSWKNKELYYLLPWNMEEGRRLKYQEYLNNEN